MHLTDLLKKLELVKKYRVAYLDCLLEDDLALAFALQELPLPGKEWVK